MTTLPLPSQESSVQTQMAYLHTVKFTVKVSTDQTGRFPVTSSRGSKYLMVLYDHDSNAILEEPLASRRKRELIRATCVLTDQQRAVTVSSGHVVKKPEVLAAVQVNTTGMKADRWSYWTMSDLVKSACKLLENRECRGMGDTGD